MPAGRRRTARDPQVTFDIQAGSRPSPSGKRRFRQSVPRAVLLSEKFVGPLDMPADQMAIGYRVDALTTLPEGLLRIVSAVATIQGRSRARRRLDRPPVTPLMPHLRHNAAVIGRLQGPSCQRNTGWVAPAGIAQTPFGPKSQPAKLAGVLICAVVSPFDAGRLPPLDGCPVVCTSQ